MALNAILGLIVLFWASAAIGIGYDARKHGGSGLKWFLITLVLGIFGVIWYSSVHAGASRQTKDVETYRVSAPVLDPETNEVTTVKMEITTNSSDSAVTRFKAECADSGYVPEAKPTVEVVI